MLQEGSQPGMLQDWTLEEECLWYQIQKVVSGRFWGQKLKCFKKG